MEKMGTIDRLKFEGILMEKIGMDGKMEGKITEVIEKIESFEEKMGKKEKRRDKTYKLEFLVIVNMFGILTLMVIIGVIYAILKRKHMLCWKRSNEHKQENYEMEERSKTILI